MKKDLESPFIPKLRARSSEHGVFFLQMIPISFLDLPGSFLVFILMRDTCIIVSFVEFVFSVFILTSYTST